MLNDNQLDDILDEPYAGATPIDRVEMASFWSRVGASLLDILILLPLIGLNVYNLYSMKSLPVALIILLLTILYKPLMEWEYGATLGKMIVKLKVVGEDLNPISLGTAFMRYSIYGLAQIPGIMTTIWLYNQEEYYRADGFMEVGLIQQAAPYQWLTWLTGLLVLVAIIWFFVSKRQQTLYDVLAKTYVVTKRSL